MIACAPMGDINASIPTPQPVHYRPMFGSLGAARHATRLTFISQAASANGIPQQLNLQSATAVVKGCRTVKKGGHDPQRSATEHHRRLANLRGARRRRTDYQRTG